MAKRNTDPISLGDALDAFVSTNKLQKGIDQVQVEKAWFDLNPAFAKYTTAIKLDRDTLLVQLSSSVFREELSYGREKIRLRLNETLGKDLIKKVIFR